MGASAIAPLAYAFNSSELAQLPFSSVAIHLSQTHPVSNISSVSATTPQCRPGFLPCPLTQITCNRKKSHVWDMSQASISCCLGMRGHVVPMVSCKSPSITREFNDLVCARVISRRRDVSVCASVIELEAEEVPTESSRRENTYEEHLPGGLCANLMPKHVAIIMDGNSRWAEKRGLPVTAGHEAGTRALTEVVKQSCKWGIQILTVFAFSTDNWFRPKMEVDFLMNLLEITLNEKLEIFQRENIQLCVMGDISKLPYSLQRMIATAEESTKHNTRLKLVIAVSYSGRHDIVQACQRLAGKVENGQLKSTEISESLFEQELETSCCQGFGSPDLLIRTSGEKRLSNFLLWQLAYTELFFDDSFWPDFGEAQYAEALHSFQDRQRRFGKRIHKETKDSL